MASIDSILNVAIPLGILVFFFVLLYFRLHEPINQLVRWLKSLFSSASDRVPDINLPTEIIYK